MQIITSVALIAFAAFSAPRLCGAEQTLTAVTYGETFTVRLSNFAFDPERFGLRVGEPVRLRLVNDSSGGHDFNAPAFFAASTTAPGSSAPTNGNVAVASHQTVEIVLTPRSPGVYRVECTHFLHSLFGMHGTVEVIP